MATSVTTGKAAAPWLRCLLLTITVCKILLAMRSVSKFRISARSLAFFHRMFGDFKHPNGISTFFTDFSTLAPIFSALKPTRWCACISRRTTTLQVRTTSCRLFCMCLCIQHPASVTPHGAAARRVNTSRDKNDPRYHNITVPLCPTRLWRRRHAPRLPHLRPLRAKRRTTDGIFYATFNHDDVAIDDVAEHTRRTWDRTLDIIPPTSKGVAVVYRAKAKAPRENSTSNTAANNLPERGAVEEHGR